MIGKRPSLPILNETEARKTAIDQKITIVTEIETEIGKETVKEIAKGLHVTETVIVTAIVDQRTVEFGAARVIIAEVDLEIEKAADHDLCAKAVVHVIIDAVALEIVAPEIA